MSIKVFNTNFYPRSPCGERRKPTSSVISVALFLSTLSLRRATACRWPDAYHAGFLSTLSLRRATGPAGGRTHITPDFYPRSPCGERPASVFLIGSRSQFLSTLSLRRATLIVNSRLHSLLVISIHALLAESDCFFIFDFLDLSFLSTLSLRRATRPTGRPAYHTGFLSTLSLRRATVAFS